MLETTLVDAAYRYIGWCEKDFLSTIKCMQLIEVPILAVFPRSHNSPKAILHIILECLPVLCYQLGEAAMACGNR